MRRRTSCLSSVTMIATRRAATVVLVCLAATLSGESHDLSERIPGRERCSNGVCFVSTEVSGVSSKLTEPELHQASPSSPSPTPDARRKRSRRVAYSHEDISANEGLQPLLTAFRESLSGRTERAVDAPHVHSEPFSSADTRLRDRGEEVGIDN